MAGQPDARTFFGHKILFYIQTTVRKCVLMFFNQYEREHFVCPLNACTARRVSNGCTCS